MTVLVTLITVCIIAIMMVYYLDISRKMGILIVALSLIVVGMSIELGMKIKNTHSSKKKLVPLLEIQKLKQN